MTRKTANETVNNSTALQNDDVLLVSLPTAGLFMFEVDLIYSSSTTADFKAAMTIPAGATFTLMGMGLVVGAAGSAGDMQIAGTTVSGTSTAFGGLGVGTFVPLRLWGEITMGGTAGNLQLQWAQQTLDATNTVVHAGSRMQTWRYS